MAEGLKTAQYYVSARKGAHMQRSTPSLSKQAHPLQLLPVAKFGANRSSVGKRVHLYLLWIVPCKYLRHQIAIGEISGERAARALQL